jgi:hypothetical protein
VNLVNHRLLEITAADSGLICNQDCHHSAVIDPPNRQTGVGKVCTGRTSYVSISSDTVHLDP